MEDRAPDADGILPYKDEDGMVSEIEARIGKMTVLFANTELIIGMAIIGLFRLATRSSKIGDQVGNVCIAELGISQKISLLFRLAKSLINDEKQLSVLANWRSGIESCITERNRITHSAWMYPLKGDSVKSFKVQRTGKIVPGPEDELNAINAIIANVSDLNQVLANWLRGLGIMPSKPA